MIYSVKITAENDEIIEFGKKDVAAEKDIITGIDIVLNTIDDNVRQKSNAMLAQLVMTGKITKEINDDLIKLFKWSQSAVEDSWYRKLEIEVKSSPEDVMRTYIFENVFVVDYKEIYRTDGTSDPSKFSVFLTQKENNLNTIDTY